MLVDVEPFFFNTFGNAETVYLIESFEDEESHAGCPCTYYEGAEYLCSEESPACTVKESFAVDKKPVRIVPVKPQTPCTELAPTGSSIFSTLSMNSTENIIRIPQIVPMMTAPSGETTSQPAVIPTKPARTPDRKSTRLNSSHTQKSRMPSSA